MILTLYSFLTSILISSVFIIIFYFLRKQNNFIISCGIGSLLLLFAVSILRTVVPIEVPEFQHIINIEVSGPAYDTMVIVLKVFLIISLIGTTVYLFILWRNHRRQALIWKLCDEIENEEAKRLLAEIDETHKLDVKQLKGVSIPHVAGILHPTVYLPDLPYTSEQLRHILTHEYNHYRNKDAWVQLLTYLYCALFWWNPVSYLLLRNLDRTLELKCDASTISSYDDTEKTAYLETIIYSINHSEDYEQKLIASSEFAADTNKFILQRFQIMTEPLPSKKKRIIQQSLFTIVVLICFILSYTIIIQPYEIIPIDEIEEDGSTYQGLDNFYLKQQKDGDYILYFDNTPTETIPKEDVENGLYYGYKIIK